MTIDDHGVPSPPDWDDWVAQQQAAAAQEPTRTTKRRGGLIAVAVALAVTAVGVGAVLYVNRGTDAEAETKPGSSPSTAEQPSPKVNVPSVSGTLPADAPSTLPSLLARPVVRPEQAFPEKTVKTADGTVYRRVDVATTTDCSRAMSQELAALIAQGKGCAQLTAALYTDAERRSQVTVSVLSFRRVEDAASVFGMVSLDPVTYQVVSLDPPAEAGLPLVPPGSPGVFNRLMTVRSVVFSNAQWADGSESREAALTKESTDLLSYANGKVVEYEQD